MKPIRRRWWVAGSIGLVLLVISAIVLAGLLGLGEFNYVDETVEIQLVSPA